MAFKIRTLGKFFVCTVLTLPLFFVDAQPAYSNTRVFGDRNAGGPNANIPRLDPERQRIVAACVDGWVDDVRCSDSAKRIIADEFCVLQGYSQSTGELYYRSNANTYHDAYVLNMSDRLFYGRVATSNPLFLTEITCEE